MTLETVVLIVEDEKRMNDLIGAYFKKDGFSVISAYDGAAGLNSFNHNKLDLVILDIMMPYMDGFTLCKKIRETSEVPIIILTAKGEEEDKLFGYELGADDYVVKPFSPKVLLAKGKALLKRTNHTDNLKEGKLSFGELAIDKLSHEVTLKGESVILSPREYDLLLYFAQNVSIVLTRDKLLDGVWGLDYFGDLRTVDTHVKRLREKLGDYSFLIETVRGTGYKFTYKDPEEQHE